MIHRFHEWMSHNWINRCFLFRSAPEGNWSGRKKAGFVAWNLLWLLAAGIGATLCSLLLSTGGYAHSIAIGFFEKPIIFLLNLAPVLIVLFLLFFAVGRAWLAFAVTGLIFVFGTMAHYYLLLFRDDPLMFADLLYLKEASKMTESYPLTADWEILFSAFAVLAGTAFLFFMVRWKPGRTVRIGGCVLFLVAAVWIAPKYPDDKLYNSTAHYTRLDNKWAAAQQYISRGFIYPFLHSISDAFPTPPPNYDAKEAQAALDAYEDAAIPEGEKVNVIGIMLEAFNDFTKFEQLEFASDVYQVWHDLEAESYSGQLTTNIFAGGTIDTERAFLTGYSSLEDYRAPTNSFVWYFKEQGYNTQGDHPSEGWFYNRKNINRYLGFDHYRFTENHYNAFTSSSVAMDKIFFPELLDSCLTAMEADEPLFSFSLNYQGHGPYATHTTYWGEPGSYVVDQGYTPEQYYILENYFGSVADTLSHLDTFVDSLRAQEEPVVLVLFGDHNPWMGDGNSVYNALGFNFDMSTEDGFYNYYNTPYLIWANDAAKEALDFDFVGEGPNVGPYFLMPLLFDLCGWEGPSYMQAIRPVAEQVPIVSVTGRFVENGVLTGTLSPENKALVDRYKALQYHESHNFSSAALGK